MRHCLKINYWFKNYLESIWEQARLQRKSQILDLLKKKKNQILLDCGCGDGGFSQKVAKKIQSNKVYGIEINKQIAQEAKKRGVRVEIWDLNKKKFPFPSRFFDVIIADQVIEHLYNLDNFVNEIYRVLKPNGYAIISTENLASWPNIFNLILGNQPFSGPAVSTKYIVGFHPLASAKRTTKRSHIKVITFKSLVQLLSFYKFKIEATRTAGYFPLPHPLAKILSFIDKNHAFFITVKVRKNLEK